MLYYPGFQKVAPGCSLTWRKQDRWSSLSSAFSFTLSLCFFDSLCSFDCVSLCRLILFSGCLVLEEGWTLIQTRHTGSTLTNYFTIFVLAPVSTYSVQRYNYKYNGIICHLFLMISYACSKAVVFFFFLLFRDVAYMGTCDDGCLALADLLGWKVSLTVSRVYSTHFCSCEVTLAVCSDYRIVTRDS